MNKPNSITVEWDRKSRKWTVVFYTLGLNERDQQRVMWRRAFNLTEASYVRLMQLVSQEVLIVKSSEMNRYGLQFIYRVTRANNWRASYPMMNTTNNWK